MVFSGTVKFREGLLTALLATLNTEHHNIRDGSIFLSLPRETSTLVLSYISLKNEYYYKHTIKM